METTTIICIYWVLAIIATYISRYYFDRKNKTKRLFNEETKVPIIKTIGTHAAIFFLIPILMPFILIYLAYNSIHKNYIKRYYRNRPKPIPKDKRSYEKKDTVYDERGYRVSLAEYNYKHNTSFSLDQVYGKGYEASLSDEEKKSIREFSSTYGILRFEESLLDTPITKAATALGNYMLSGDFDEFANMLDNDVETILYGVKTIVGKNDVAEYWKGWRERFVITKKVTEFSVLHSYYYSDSCLQMKTMVVLCIMEASKIKRLVLVRRHITGGVYRHHDDLVTDYPFNLKYIKRHINPFDDEYNLNISIAKENHLPCFSCGAKSENLKWYRTKILVDNTGYYGFVSICPNCGKVVEYITERGYGIKDFVIDENDMLEEYANCWNTLSIGKLEDCLSDDFHYSSFWVFAELDKTGYIEYFTKKLNKIDETGSKVKAKIEDNLLVVNQDGKNVVIAVKFKDGKIVRADMSPASFYGIDDKEAHYIPEFKLLGRFCYFNDCPLKDSKYTEKIPDNSEITIIDYDKLNHSTNNYHSTKHLKQIAEECEWLYFTELANNNKQSLELIKSCYQDAINEGIYEAANNLGIIAVCYEDNLEEGKKWFNYAAMKGSKNAMLNLFNVHWTNEEYLEGIAILEDMPNKKDPSLKCLWNLAYLYYMGDNCPHNTIKQDIYKAKQILSQIANFDKNLACKNEITLPEKAKEMIDYVKSSNVFADNAVDYHNILLSSVIKPNGPKSKSEVFRRLSSIELAPGYKLGLRLASTDTVRGDESNFFVYDDSDKADSEIIKYIRAIPTTMSAWQIYLLMTSQTVMPVYWHGGYIVRKFIFKENDLEEIKQLQNLDLSILKDKGLLLPSVTINTDENNKKSVAHVYCCYWNEWKGLVREHATIVFNGNNIESFKNEDEITFYDYDCGICF